MPPALLIDLASIDLNRIIIGKDEILRNNPQRYEFEQLDGIVHYDVEKHVMVGLREIKADEWWTRGHIPGRPLFPGVLMIEAAAQLASLFGKKVMDDLAFIGFGGVDKVKFREAVVPPARLYILAKAVELRRRRIICDVQGVVDGRIVFEGQITGVPM
jgi:3-hydroxyacyl-[acyl-carrier-protein] dehydratase